MFSRPSLVQLESIMHNCWQQSPHDRPMAKDIVKDFQHAQVACQHRQLHCIQQVPDVLIFFSVHADDSSSTPYVKAALERRVSRRTSSRPHRTPAGSRKSSRYHTPKVQELLFASLTVGQSRMLSFADVNSDSIVNSTEVRSRLASRSVVLCAATVGGMLWLGTGGPHDDSSHVEVYAYERARLRQLVVFSTEKPVLSLYYHSFADARNGSVTRSEHGPGERRTSRNEVRPLTV